MSHIRPHRSQRRALVPPRWRWLAAATVAAALAGCGRGPDVPTFDPPPPGTPAPKAAASDAAGRG